MSKSSFCETFWNDCKEYLLQVLLFTMTAIVYSLIYESSNKKAIEIFTDLVVPNNGFVSQLLIYLFVAVLLFIFTTIILTMLASILNWAKNLFKKNSMKNKKIKEQNKILSWSEVKYSSPLFFKRAGSTCANVGSVGISVISILTFLWAFPHLFELSEADKKFIETIKYDEIIIYWVVMVLFFMMMIAWKSFSSVYIEAWIKNRSNR